MQLDSLDGSLFVGRAVGIEIRVAEIGQVQRLGNISVAIRRNGRLSAL